MTPRALISLTKKQFAYSLAAAHLRLSHQTSISLMVSDTHAQTSEQDWSFVDSRDGSDLCVQGGKSLLDRLLSPSSLSSEQQRPRVLPRVVHYCSTAYGVGYWYFSKYDFPDQFLSCDYPLLREPSREDVISSLARYPEHFFCPNGSYFYPDGGEQEFPTAEAPKRSAFLTCEILRALNGAATYYKGQHCRTDVANLRKTFTFHPPDMFP
jgi:hypothetical protein